MRIIFPNRFIKLSDGKILTNFQGFEYIKIHVKMHMMRSDMIVDIAENDLKEAFFQTQIFSKISDR